MRVLVVEDAWRLAEAVAEILRGEGWSADVATDGARGAELAAAGAYDCVLLDVMLPVMGGLDVLRGMREAGDATPVILVTARDAVPDRVAGLDAGADDYLVKPFHAEELLARVRAVCRRPRAIEEAGPLRALGLELDEGSLELRAAGCAAVSLRARECQLLAELMARPGRVVAKRELIDRVWGPARPEAVSMRVSKFDRRICRFLLDGTHRGRHRARRGVRPAGGSGRGRAVRAREGRRALPPELARLRRRVALASSALMALVLAASLAGAWLWSARGYASEVDAALQQAAGQSPAVGDGSSAVAVAGPYPVVRLSLI